MQHFPPLFAAFDDIIGWLVVLLFVIVPAIGQLLAKMRQAQPPGGAPGPKKPPAEVADEIEVFMRRVLGGEEAPEKPPVKPQPRPVEQPVRAELIEEEPSVEKLTEHAKDYFDSDKSTKHTDNLGQEVASTGNQFEQHSHQVFDHELEQLDTAASQASPINVGTASTGFWQTPEAPPLFATSLSVMLSDPDSLAQAIILSEIIHRPEERWS